MKIVLLLNNNLNFLFLKKNDHKYIIVYNKTTGTYIKYKFDLNVNIFYFKNLKYLIVELNFFNYNNKKILNTLLNKQIKSIDFYFVKKIVFFGKGFKIKKSEQKNTLSLFFNKSHINFITWNNIIVKKLKKTKIILCSSNYKYIDKSADSIIKNRKLNIFTKKGLRLSRQLIFKKVGKKTT